MAKVNLKFNKQRLEADVIKRIESVTDSKELKQEIGLFATDRIRFQARVKKPLNDSGSFPSLKKVTVEQREYLEKFNTTDRTYQSGRSNLTFTGQLLNSVAFKTIRDGIELFFKGSRRPYKTGPGSRAKKTPTNEELAEFLSKLGFEVFTKKGIEGDRKFNTQVNRIVRKFLRRSLRR